METVKYWGDGAMREEVRGEDFGMALRKKTGGIWGHTGKPSEAESKGFK